MFKYDDSRIPNLKRLVLMIGKQSSPIHVDTNPIQILTSQILWAWDTSGECMISELKGTSSRFTDYKTCEHLLFPRK